MHATVFRILGAALLSWALAPESSHAQRWEYRLASGDEAAALRIDPSGDVIAAGRSVTNATGMDATIVKVSGATGAELWRRSLAGTFPDGYDEANVLALGSSGGAFVGGRVRNVGTAWDLLVARLSGADGSVVWRTEIDGTGTDTYDPLGSTITDGGFYGLTLDPAGDVLAAGALYNVAQAVDFTVAKLDGATGALLWTYSIPDPAYSYAFHVATDANGDVFATGTTAPDSFTVVKLAGTTGSELWRYQTPGNGIRLAATGSGDVIAVGAASGASQGSLLAVRLSGADGSEVWRTTIGGPVGSSSFGNSVVLDGAGDVIVGGSIGISGPSADFAAVKLAGATGAELWRYTTAAASGLNSYAMSIAVGPTGEVVAAGAIAEFSRYDQLGVVALDGASGAPRWRRVLGGGDETSSAARDVVVAAGGDVLVAGRLPGSAFGVVRFDGATGNDYLLAGSRLRVRDSASRPSKRLLQLDVRDPAAGQALDPSAGDPRSGGATLELLNPTTLESSVLPLPAGGWQAVTTARDGTRFVYRDEDRTAGPCTKAQLESRRIKAVCGGAGIGFTLDEPSQGSLAVRLTAGTGEVRRCFVFGGRVIRDAAGVFKARSAPVPAACP